MIGQSLIVFSRPTHVLYMSCEEKTHDFWQGVEPFVGVQPTVKKIPNCAVEVSIKYKILSKYLSPQPQ